MSEDHLPPRRLDSQELARLLDGWRDDQPAAAGYTALAGRLRTLVLDGRLPVHAVLPSERALALLIGASRTLTTAAYGQLRQDGFAESRHGSGTWTALPHAREDASWPPASSSGEASQEILATAAPEAPPELHAAYLAALADLPRFLPGHGYVSAGLPELRAAIAERYTVRGLPTSGEEIVVTAGAAQGIRLLLALLLRPADRMISEDPTWPLTLDAARGRSARPVALPVENGWDVAMIRGLIRRTGAGVGYLMPDAQNPTGRLLDGPERHEVAAAFADGGCLVVVDETLAELDLRADLGEEGAVTPAPFGAGGRPGSVVHVGSASKLFWGGLRIGWVRAERSLVQRLTLARRDDDLGGPLVEQLAVLHLFEGIEPLLLRRRAEMAARCRALQAALAVQLPDWIVPDPQAGLSLWCRLPSPSGVGVAQAARAAGIPLAAGPRFGVDGGHTSRIRLTFSAPPAQLERSVGRLAAALRDARAGTDDGRYGDGRAEPRVV
ncbi:MAG TPA: PLP-dependent aminotransferase family protein [Kineosporiaceae bacterium]|nr:PLP-dependent aminotransferase family protein [Kineosporiaceae bacterium]